MRMRHIQLCTQTPRSAACSERKVCRRGYLSQKGGEQAMPTPDAADADEDPCTCSLRLSGSPSRPSPARVVRSRPRDDDRRAAVACCCCWSATRGGVSDPHSRITCACKGQTQVPTSRRSLSRRARFARRRAATLRCAPSTDICRLAMTGCCSTLPTPCLRLPGAPWLRASRAAPAHARKPRSEWEEPRQRAGARQRPPAAALIHMRSI